MPLGLFGGLLIFSPLVTHDHNPSDSCVLDEVGALLAGLGSDVEYSSLTRCQACLKYGVMLCVNGETGELIVIGTCRYVRVTELPPGATTVTTV